MASRSLTAAAAAAAIAVTAVASAVAGDGRGASGHAVPGATRLAQSAPAAVAGSSGTFVCQPAFTGGPLPAGAAGFPAATNAASNTCVIVQVGHGPQRARCLQRSSHPQ